ncbi:hypothetical protein EDC01DRAFT_681387, partial [Geopyxis carbonaria]
KWFCGFVRVGLGWVGLWGGKGRRVVPARRICAATSYPAHPQVSYISNPDTYYTSRLLLRKFGGMDKVVQSGSFAWYGIQA